MEKEANFKTKFKKFFRRLMFWKPIDDSLQSGYFDSILNSLLVLNKSEKKKVLTIIEKHNVQNLLFYTDLRNIPNILNQGIRMLKDINLQEEEAYYVWSYLQHDDSIDLEFDLSTRGNFWKWTSDINFNPKKMAVIGIDPDVLNRLTERDWIFDQSANLVNITENIQPEAISWVMVRDETAYNKLKTFIKDEDLKIDIYLGNEGLVRKGIGDHNNGKTIR
ncbi:hypothetical protein [Mesoplasma seiffertii]|uniref:hypothetical protein n=1 Tax=Mesoplasma seiffertii TaxID=28224 RepID=UPI00056C7E1B|nr:hypothetical protein [Mesoplasma seiffertii]